MVSFFDAISLM